MFQVVSHMVMHGIFKLIKIKISRFQFVLKYKLFKVMLQKDYFYIL